MLLLVYALVGLVGAITAISLSGFNVDLALSALFYEPSRQDFVAGQGTSLGLLRDHGVIAVVTCVTLVGLAMQRSRRLPTVPGRAAVFLALSLVVGPGLLVNVALKDNWGRPRPGKIVEFGGLQKYVDWWDTRGACRTNCSLASGEAASAAWMFGPAMIAPAPWRAAAMAGAAVFTVTMSLLRLAAGGAFPHRRSFGRADHADRAARDPPTRIPLAMGVAGASTQPCRPRRHSLISRVAA